MSEATVRCPKCGHDGIVITELLDSDVRLLADKLASDNKRLIEAAEEVAKQLDSDDRSYLHELAAKLRGDESK